MEISDCQSQVRGHYHVLSFQPCFGKGLFQLRECFLFTLFWRRHTPATDANRCHTDANHCHSAPMADQSAREALSSLPEP